jgi:hypothetical protein
MGASRPIELDAYFISLRNTRSYETDGATFSILPNLPILLDRTVAVWQDPIAKFRFDEP